jgi:hypothetical protein
MPPVLLEKLMQTQQQNGLSDRAFARTLRISHSLWVKTRSRAYPVRFQVLAGTVLAFPHLDQDVLAYLRDSATQRKA